MAVASATECGLTIESENNACMIMVLMPSAATKAIIQKIILTNKGRDVTTQHPMGISNRLTVVLQQELH